MEDSRPAGGAIVRRIALLIDADNISHAKAAAILAELSRYGTANIRRAYGDWTSPALQGWRDMLHSFAIRPIQQFCYSTEKTLPISRWSSMRWNCSTRKGPTPLPSFQATPISRRS